MELDKITSESIQGVDDRELLSLHRRLHQIWGNLFAKALNPEELGDVAEHVTESVDETALTPTGWEITEEDIERVREQWGEIAELEDYAT